MDMLSTSNHQDFIMYIFNSLNALRSIVSSGEVLQHKGSNEHIRDSVTHYGADTSDVKVLSAYLAFITSCMMRMVVAFLAFFFCIGLRSSLIYEVQMMFL